MEDFRYVSYSQEIIFAAGSLSRLTEAIERLGSRRFLLCANQSLQDNGRVDAVKSALGERMVLVFDHIRPHVPDVQVNEILARTAENNIDAVIGMGGGSSIGMAKAVAAALNKKQADEPTRVMLPGDSPAIPLVAIPTTYAGSEMTAMYGVTHTDENPPRKVTVSNPMIAPKLVIYDPDLTLDLPKEMTASTGINALAHCVEALYSKTRNPLSTAAATSGAQHIVNALLSCYHDGNDLAARIEMLLGAHLAGLSLASVSMGLHHGLCHVLGGTANIPHGIANSIILPHAIRFNADATAAQLIPVAEAMGVPANRINPMVAAEALVQKIFHLIGQMQLPQRLRDAGVAESDLPQLAKLGFQNRTVQNNPKPITSADEIEKLLREAW